MRVEKENLVMEIPITEEFGLAHCWNNLDENFPANYEDYHCEVLVTIIFVKINP